MFSVKEIATSLQVSSNTIRAQWGREFADYLSPGANPPKGHKRKYNQDDLDVFATIATLRNQEKSYEDIHQALADGTRLRPDAFIEVGEHNQTLTLIYTHLSQISALLDEKDKQIATLRDQLQREREARQAAEMDAAKLRGK